MIRAKGFGAKNAKLMTIPEVQDHKNGAEELRLLLDEEDELSLTEEMNRTTIIAVDRIAKLCNRNCFFVTFIVILCCTFITVSRLQQNLRGPKATADDDLYFLLLNPFLDTFIRPENETCLVCPKRLQHQCKNRDNLKGISKTKEDLQIVYMVTSAPNHWRQRSAIRDTYGSVAYPQPVFITGWTEDETEMRMLTNEALLYKDIIVEDFMDSYWNLTLKTGFILKQFLQLCPQADFLVKVDDDMFIQPHIIAEILSTATADQLTGSLQQGAIPYRDPLSKYYLPYWLYNRSVLPDFLSGITYILPGKRVPEILETSFSIPLLNLEDVFYTGIVAQTLNLPLIWDKRIRTKQMKDDDDALCKLRSLAGYHEVTSKRLLEVWPKVQNLTSEDCDNATNEEEDSEEPGK